MRRVNGIITCGTAPHDIMTGGWIRTDERLISGLSVIDDTYHQKAKQKGDACEPCVTPLKKDQVVDKDK